jgi:hypothetical protein
MGGGKLMSLKKGTDPMKQYISGILMHNIFCEITTSDIPQQSSAKGNRMVETTAAHSGYAWDPDFDKEITPMKVSSCYGKGCSYARNTSGSD